MVTGRPPGARTVDEILAAARALGFALRVHADQFRPDGAAQLAAEMGAATADHLEFTDEEGLRALARTGVQPVLLPASAYHLGSARYPAARRMIETVQHPTIGDLKLLGVPFKFSDTPAAVRRPPPTLGEHTDEILGEIGMDGPAIAKLRAERVV